MATSRVKLGSQGLEVSKLGFGCMGLSGSYNSPVSDDVGILIIKHAFDSGITLFDTSDVYGPDHANEILVGKALKHLAREKVQVATKFGISRNSAGNQEICGKPDYVRACCEASLKRLGIEYIDIYYQHRVDTTIPIEETIGELKKLVEEGKVKYIGLSEASPNTIRRAHAVFPITAFTTAENTFSDRSLKVQAPVADSDPGRRKSIPVADTPVAESIVADTQPMTSPVAK